MAVQVSLPTAASKTHLVILDFVANHKGFLKKPQALLAEFMNYQALASLGKKLADGPLEIAEGCFLNYDLELINFSRELGRSVAGVERDNEALADVLGRRPTPTEFYRFGASFSNTCVYGHPTLLVTATRVWTPSPVSHEFGHPNPAFPNALFGNPLRAPQWQRRP